MGYDAISIYEKVAKPIMDMKLPQGVTISYA